MEVFPGESQGLGGALGQEEPGWGYPRGCAQGSQPGWGPGPTLRPEHKGNISPGSPGLWGSQVSCPSPEQDWDAQGCFRQARRAFRVLWPSWGAHSITAAQKPQDCAEDPPAALTQMHKAGKALQAQLHPVPAWKGLGHPACSGTLGTAASPASAASPAPLPPLYPLPAGQWGNRGTELCAAGAHSPFSSPCSGSAEQGRGCPVRCPPPPSPLSHGSVVPSRAPAPHVPQQGAPRARRWRRPEPGTGRRRADRAGPRWAAIGCAGSCWATLGCTGLY